MAGTSSGVPIAVDQQNKQPSQDLPASMDEAEARENEIASKHSSGECVRSLTSGKTLAPDREGRARGTIGTTIAPSSKTKTTLTVFGCLLLMVSWTFGQNQSNVPKINDCQGAIHDELKALQDIAVAPAGRFSEVCLPAAEGDEPIVEVNCVASEFLPTRWWWDDVSECKQASYPRDNADQRKCGTGVTSEFLRAQWWWDEVSWCQQVSYSLYPQQGVARYARGITAMPNWRFSETCLPVDKIVSNILA